MVQFLIIFLIGFLFFKSDNIFTELLSNRIEAAESDKGAGRLVIWKVALPMIADNPILGVGYRNFPSEFKYYFMSTPLPYEESIIFIDKNRVGAHNAILENLSELGLIGFIFFYSFQYSLFRRLKAIKLNYYTLLFVILVAINVNSLFGDLVNLKYFWLIIAICFGFIAAQKKGP